MCEAINLRLKIVFWEQYIHTMMFVNSLILEELFLGHIGFDFDVDET